MNISLIKNDRKLEKAISNLKSLMGKSSEPSGEMADKIKLLALVIEDYEKIHYPIASPSPVDAIKFRMEQMDLSVKELEPCIGKSNRVYEVLAGKRKLSINMIRKLSRALKIPADILIGTV
ncbi:MAG: hypothetical protein A2017_01760 [Lentisphaerae bacterium GWF2_44_16]|nr:MAG: hypothetical protein A2017_01760 [Lentisphaerae bacterium GWF2_44_16]